MPLLVVLFVISYCILTLLVFEQGQTIEAQRGLIKEMLKDSNQLAAMKDRLVRDDINRIQEKAAAALDHKPIAPGNRSTATAPAVNATPKAPNKQGKTAKTTNEVPTRPPADLQDVRRITRVI
jgi:hypothetical protein